MATEYWTRVGQWRVIDNQDYNLDVEDWRSDDAQMTFLHCSVRVWAPSVLKSIRSDLALLRECVRGDFYATSNTPDDKWQRFMKLLGFSHLIDSDNGRKIFILRDNHGRLRH